MKKKITSSDYLNIEIESMHEYVDQLLMQKEKDLEQHYKNFNPFDYHIENDLSSEVDILRKVKEYFDNKTKTIKESLKNKESDKYKIINPFFNEHSVEHNLKMNIISELNRLEKLRTESNVLVDLDHVFDIIQDVDASPS